MPRQNSVFYLIILINWAWHTGMGKITKNICSKWQSNATTSKPAICCRTSGLDWEKLLMFLHPPPVHPSVRMNLNILAENLIPVLPQKCIKGFLRKTVGSTSTYKVLLWLWNTTNYLQHTSVSASLQIFSNLNGWIYYWVLVSFSAPQTSGIISPCYK